MRLKRHLTLTIFLLLLSTDLLETFVQFCFKKTSLVQAGISLSSISEAVIFVKTAALTPFLWVGLFAVIALFVIWATVLSRIDLSVAVPVASFSYVFIPLVSIVFLHEKISLLRWLGIGFILAGVVIVSLSSRQKKGEA